MEHDGNVHRISEEVSVLLVLFLSFRGAPKYRNNNMHLTFRKVHANEVDIYQVAHFECMDQSHHRDEFIHLDEFLHLLILRGFYQ